MQVVTDLVKEDTLENKISLSVRRSPGVGGIGNLSKYRLSAGYLEKYRLSLTPGHY